MQRHRSQEKRSSSKKNPYEPILKSSYSSLKPYIKCSYPRSPVASKMKARNLLVKPSYHSGKGDKLEDRIVAFERQAKTIEEKQKLRNSAYQAFLRKLRK